MVKYVHASSETVKMTEEDRSVVKLSSFHCVRTLSDTVDTSITCCSKSSSCWV